MVSQSHKKASKKGTLAFLFAFSFILNGYASGIPGLSLGSVVFVCLVFYSIVQSSFHTAYPQSNLILLFFLIISILDYFSVTNSLDYLSIFKEVSKYMIWAFMISFCSYSIFDKEEVFKWMKRISYVLLSYLFVQYISFYGLSHYLPNIFEIGPLHAYDAGYASDELGEGFIIRPASFLSESSFLGGYLICTLIMTLVEIQKEYSRKLFKDALLFSLGIILTSSTSAIIMLPLIWFFLGSNSYKNNKKLFLIFGSLLLWGGIGVFAIFSTLGDSDNALIYSFFYTFDKFENLEGSTRFGNSYAFLSYLPGEYRLLGVGIGNEIPFLKPLVYSEHYYMNSLTLMLIQVGWLGLIIFVLYLLSLVIQSIKYRVSGATVLIILYFIQGIGSGIWMGTYGILFMYIANGYIITAKKEFKKNKIFK